MVIARLKRVSVRDWSAAVRLAVVQLNEFIFNIETGVNIVYKINHPAADLLSSDRPGPVTGLYLIELSPP